MQNRLFCLILALISCWGWGEINRQTLIIEVEPGTVEKIQQVQEVEDFHVSFQFERVFSNTRNQIIKNKNWYLATPTTRTEMTGWELAHYMLSEHEGVKYAEPDWVDVPTYGDSEQREARGCEVEKMMDFWPRPKSNNFAWHLDSSHSQLKSARDKHGLRGENIRIAHFDTGYDPKHISLPENIRTDLGRNFVDGENPNSAIDPGIGGLGEMPGHGTATLAILAGNKVNKPEHGFNDYFGGAPHAEVVPVRLAKSVVLLQVSAFAKAIYYALEQDCDVVSMSMGGVASKFWAEAINDAYDQGMVVVTAAGNNFGKKPTRYVVYPARFKRVVAVCGAAYDDTPYYKFGLLSFKMQGCYGPKNVMKTSIAAYTPNLPWARLGCVDVFDLDGGGTSAATPQVAAAATLWLQKYKDQKYDQPWQRVNSVRNALFSTADKSYKDSETYYGNGIVKADAALGVKPNLSISALPKDKVSSPFLTLLLGWDDKDSRDTTREMLITEMAQVELNYPSLAYALEKLENGEAFSSEERLELCRKIAELDISPALKNLLQQVK